MYPAHNILYTHISGDYSTDYIIRRIYLDLKKMYSRKDRTLLDSGFYDSETWRGLRSCWKGYKIAKTEFDTTRMEYYAKGIRKFARHLGIPVRDFPQFGLVGRIVEQERESENDLIWGSYEQVEKVLEDHESQTRYEQQQQHSDYIINQEVDLRKAQMEYIIRNLRYFVEFGPF